MGFGVHRIEQKTNVRVEFFGTTGSGKTTAANKLLAAAPMFAARGIILQDGKTSCQNARRLLEGPTSVSSRIKRSLMRLLPLEKHGDDARRGSSSSILQNQEQLTPSFNRLIAAFEGAPVGIDFSTGLINWARQQFRLIACERFYCSHPGAPPSNIFSYDEGLVHLSVALLKFNSYAENKIEGVVNSLPESDLYFYFNTSADECRRGVATRDPEGINKDIRLQTLDAAHRLSAVARDCLQKKGRNVISVDRSTTSAEMCAWVLDVFSEKQKNS